MAENPLQKLARLVGAVVLLQGRLGHQVLGQTLIMGSPDLELAAGNVVIAAASNARSGAMKAALQTTGSAIAITLLDRRQRRRLARDQALTRRHEQTNQARQAMLEEQRKALAARETEYAALQTRLSELEQANKELQLRLEAALTPVDAKPRGKKRHPR